MNPITKEICHRTLRFAADIIISMNFKQLMSPDGTEIMCQTLVKSIEDRHRIIVQSLVETKKSMPDNKGALEIAMNLQCMATAGHAVELALKELETVTVVE